MSQDAVLLREGAVTSLSLNFWGQALIWNLVGAQQTHVEVNCVKIVGLKGPHYADT